MILVRHCACSAKNSMPKTLKTLDVEAVRYLAHALAKKMMEWGEPIPDFETRYPNILEACIASPFQTFDKKLLYKGLEEKAAALFYGLIKNHPFQNGNKRIAVATLLVFLYRNGKWLKVDSSELYRFAVWIAQSPPDLRNEVMPAIKKFIRKNLIGFE
jgi:death-on-curing protein